MKRPRARTTLIAVAAMAVGPVAIAAKRFDIPQGNAADTVEAFIQQSGLELVYDVTDVERYTTRAVRGTYEPIDTLRLMFEGISLLAVPGKRGRVRLIDCSSNPRHRETCEKAGKLVRMAAPHADANAASEAEPVTREVTVTGSLIRRSAAFARDPYLITISSDDIDASGTLAQALQAQPGVHGSGPTEDTFESGTDAPTNSGRGIGTNLRGFGAGATLVLVNGHRIAASGTDAAFADVSNFSSLFIEETHLLADAASAVYGADAVGGVVNVLTRRDFSGNLSRARYGIGTGGALGERQVGQLFGRDWGRFHGVFGVDYRSSDALPAADRRQASSDLTSLGGNNFSTDFANPGNIRTPAGFLAIPAGQDGKSLALADLIPGQPNLRDLSAYSDVIAAQKLGSAYVALLYRARDDLTFDLDAYFSRRRARAASGSTARLMRVPYENAFAKQLLSPEDPPLEVGYDFYDDLGQKTLRADVRTSFVTFSLDRELRNDWHVAGYVRRAAEWQKQSVDNLVITSALDDALDNADPGTAFNPFGDGSHTTRAVIESIRTAGLTHTRSRTSSMGFDATGPLPSVLGRELSFAAGVDYREQTLLTDIRTGDAAQDANYHYTRDALAVVAQLDVAVLPKKLNLSFSSRYESFRGAGDAPTSRIKAEWAPSKSLTLFGNWSQSFRLPPLGQFDEERNGTLIQPLPDRGGVPAPVLFEFGKNASLEPETAESWSAGLRFEPAITGLALRLSYFNVRIRNRIESPVANAQLLLDPDLAHLVTRNPTPAQRETVCNRTDFFGTPGGCLVAPVDAIVDLRLRNIAVLESRGIELFGTWNRELRAGALELDVSLTRVIDFEQAQTDRHPLVEKLDTEHQPNDLRLLAAARWQRGAFGASGTLNFADRYRDMRSMPTRSVDSWTTFDAALAYAFGDFDLSLAAENLFNRSPPFLNNFKGLGYDAENADLKGRRVTLMLRKDW